MFHHYSIAYSPRCAIIFAKQHIVMLGLLSVWLVAEEEKYFSL
jgi:hypothetical protein